MIYGNLFVVNHTASIIWDMYMCIMWIFYQCTGYLLENPLSLLGAGEGVSVENKGREDNHLALGKDHQIYMLQTKMFTRK